MIKLLIVADSCYYVEEAKSSIVAKVLMLTHIKSRQSVTSSNKQKYKWFTCDFRLYKTYKSFLNEITCIVSAKLIGFIYRIFYMTDFYFLN